MRLLEHNILFKFAILILSSVLLIACSDSDRASERSMNQQRAPFTTAGSDVILACAKKENGQLRIVEDHSECHPSENPVSWNVAGPAGPPGAQGSQGQCSNCEPLQYQLVGFSQQGGPGATGVLQLTSYCQASYPASRICTTEEVVKSVTFPAVTSSPSNPGPSAWVAPTAIAGRGSSMTVANFLFRLVHRVLKSPVVLRSMPLKHYHYRFYQSKNKTARSNDSWVKKGMEGL